MPELPEVEIVKQSLSKKIRHKKVKKIIIKNRNLRFKLDHKFSNIVKNSNALGSLTKFELKQFFQFGIDFIRQAFFYSEGLEKLYEFESLNDFSIENFAVYVNDTNYKKLVSLFDLNLGYVKRNGLFRDANSKLLSTSFLLGLSDILYKKN